MVKNVKIYVLTSDKLSVDLMDSVTSFYRKEQATFQVSNSYEYNYLSLHQLVMLAKRRKYAMDILINQSLKDIIVRSKAIVRRNPNLTFEEVYFNSIHLLKKCVQSYQSDKGEFDHYFHSAMFQNVRYMNYSYARRLDVERKKYGCRVDMTSFSDNHLLCDCSPDVNKTYQIKALRVDAEEYVASLEGMEKEVMRLFFRGYSATNIAKELNLNKGKTSRMLQRLLKDFRSKYYK